MNKIRLLRCAGCLLGGLVYLAFIDPILEKTEKKGEKLNSKPLLCRLGLHKWKLHGLIITDPKFIPSLAGMFHPIDPPRYVSIIKVCKRCGTTREV